MMYGHYGYGNGWVFLFMIINMLLFWALVVAVVVWLVRSVAADRQAPTWDVARASRPTARDILDERYARGEIGDEEYRSRLNTLTSR